MKNLMEHRGLFGTVHYDDKERVLFGKIEDVSVPLLYKAKDTDTLRAKFEAQVDNI